MVAHSKKAPGSLGIGVVTEFIGIQRRWQISDLRHDGPRKVYEKDVDHVDRRVDPLKERAPRALAGKPEGRVTRAVLEALARWQTIAPMSDDANLSLPVLAPTNPVHARTRGENLSALHHLTGYD
jgi:hypothetical protein